MTPQEILAKASEYMSERGWTTNTYEDSKTHEVCAYGAMTLAATEGETTGFANPELNSTVTKKLIERAAQLLARQISQEPYASPDPFWAVTGFNDNATSGEEVILAMKRAAHG